MPGRTLPTIPLKSVVTRNTSKSCYVTIGTKVYDITPFIEDHPGGGDLILEWGGKDVTDIMSDEVSHFHSESAYEVLQDHLIGFVATEPVMNAAKESDSPFDILPLPPNEDGKKQLKAHNALEIVEKKPVYATTGMASEADLKVETDANADYKTHKFLDLEKPLLMQVWNGGFTKDFYLEQVHRPRYYKGGDSAPLFGNFLEPLTKTPWWLIPMVWMPPVIYGSSLAFQHLPSSAQSASFWLLGLFLWTLVEYGLHRGLFHVDA